MEKKEEKVMKAQNEKTMKVILKHVFLLVGMILFTINVQSQTEVPAQQPASDTATDSIETQFPASETMTDSTETEKPVFTRHELSLWAAGGYSSLYYRPTAGSRDIFAYGGAAGLGYSIFFNKNWGLLLGGELAYYKATYRLNDFKNDGYRITLDTYNANDPLHDFYYTSEYRNFVETQTLVNVNIPLMLQFQPTIFDYHKFYLGLGVKFGIPIRGHYVVDTSSEMDAWGYSEMLNQNLPEVRRMGFGENFNGFGKKQDLTFGYSYTAMLELGFRWRLASRLYMYTGIYADYTFNDIAKEHGREILVYGDRDLTEQNYLVTNSVLNSSYHTISRAANHSVVNDVKTQFVNKVSPLSFGLKLRFGIDLSKNVEKKKKNEKADKAENAQNKSNVPCNCFDIESLERLFDLYNRKCSSEKHKDDDSRKGNNNGNGNGNGNNGNAYKDRGKNTNYYGKDYEQIERARTAAEYGELKDMIIVSMDGYNVNQSELSPIMKMMLDDQIRLLQQYNNDNYTIICEGHTCSLGTSAYNWNLGQKRADGVKNYLVSQGFRANNLVTISKGSTTPIVANTNESNRKINRRVVFLIKEKK